MASTPIASYPLSQLQSAFGLPHLSLSLSGCGMIALARCTAILDDRLAIDSKGFFEKETTDSNPSGDCIPNTSAATRASLKTSVVHQIPRPMTATPYIKSILIIPPDA